MSSALNIVFAGTPAFAATILQELLESEHRIVGVYTQPDRPAGRGRKVRPGPVKILATEAGLPLHQPERFDETECQHLAEAQADVMLVFAYGLLLPQAALECEGSAASTFIPRYCHLARLRPRSSGPAGR